MSRDSSVSLDYRVWKNIDYRPAVSALLPTALLNYLKPGQRVIEIGCGKGDVALYLASHGLAVEGFDLNPAAIAEAQQKAETARLSNLTRFQVADFVECEALPAPADAAVLIRVLTCLPDSDDLRRLMDRVWRCLKPGGLLFVHDFLLTPETYEARYRAGTERGLSYGTFLVPGQEGEPLFWARHYAACEITAAFARFDVLSFDEVHGVSMRGNRCRLLVAVGRRSLDSVTASQSATQ